jgi:hypothetical protein
MEYSIGGGRGQGIFKKKFINKFLDRHVLKLPLLTRVVKSSWGQVQKEWYQT